MPNWSLVEVPTICSLTSCGVVTLKTGRREMPGSNPSHACRSNGGHASCRPRSHKRTIGLQYTTNNQPTICKLGYNLQFMFYFFKFCLFTAVYGFTLRACRREVEGSIPRHINRFTGVSVVFLWISVVQNLCKYGLESHRNTLTETSSHIRTIYFNPIT